MCTILDEMPEETCILMAKGVSYSIGEPAESSHLP